MEELFDAQMQQIRLLQRIELEQGIINKKLDDIIEYQNLIVLRPTDLSELFKVSMKTIRRWLNENPLLSIEVGGAKFVTISNVKLLFEMKKDKFELVEDDLVSFIEKWKSPTHVLLRDFLTNH